MLKQSLGFLRNAGGIAALVPLAVIGQPTAPLATFQKPAWLTDLSVSVKESHDDNVYLAGVGAMRNHSSWLTTVTPKFDFNFAPLLGTNQFPTLAFGYAPEITAYHRAPAESCTAHRLGNTVKGRAGALSFALENGFTFVDGSEVGPAYPDGRSCYATSGVRERREQLQDRAKITLQYDADQWFVRPTAALLYYDLMTALKDPSLPTTPTGYDNYADRYDVNGGVDLGWRLHPHLAATVGYRYGHQSEQQYSFDPLHLGSSSDYQRVLLGLEGNPWSWLTVALQAGPDFRSYAPNTATHTTPVSNPHRVTYYGEAALAAKISAGDTVTFKFKQWQWLSSTGKVPYFDGSYDLAYNRKCTEKLSVNLGGRLLTADYTSGNLVTCKRDDWQYTVSAGASYALTAHFSTAVAYAVDLGRNNQDGLTANPATREYDRHLVSLGVQYRF